MRDQAYPSLWETQPLYTLGGCVGGLVLADLALVPLSARVGGLLSGHGVGTTSGLPLPTTLTHAVADGIESTWHISPAAFWVGHVLCTIVLLAIIALGLRTWRRLFKTDRQSIEQSLRDSSSVWASAADVESAGLVIADRAATSRLILGDLDKPGERRHPIVAAPAGQSCVVVAPTGSGKTAGTVIPGILRHDGPLVTTSTKPDVFMATSSHRAAPTVFPRSTVWVLDPEDVCGVRYDSPGRNVRWAKWTPLPECRTLAGAERVAASLVSAASKATTDATAEFWQSQGRIFVTALLHWAACCSIEGCPDNSVCDRGDEDVCEEHRQERTMLDIYRTLLAFDAPIEEGVTMGDVVLDELADAVDCPGREDAIAAIRAVMAQPANQRGGTISSAQSLFEPYASAMARDVLSAPTTDPGQIDWDDLLDNDGTLYLVASSSTQEKMRPVFEAILDSLAARVADRALRRQLPEHRLLVMLDEAAHCASPARLPTWLNEGRAQRMTIVSIWQNISQIEGAYGERWRTVWAGHPAKLMLGGVHDQETLEWQSAMVGSEAVTSHSYSSDGMGGVSMQVGGRDLSVAPVEWLRQRPVWSAIATVGNGKPMQLTTTPFFRDASLLSLIPASVQRELAAAVAN